MVIQIKLVVVVVVVVVAESYPGRILLLMSTTRPVPELSFLPTHIGAEPGRAKEESRITCMHMLRTHFPPKSGENLDLPQVDLMNFRE